MSLHASATFSSSLQTERSIIRHCHYIVADLITKWVKSDAKMQFLSVFWCVPDFILVIFKKIRKAIYFSFGNLINLTQTPMWIQLVLFLDGCEASCDSA